MLSFIMRLVSEFEREHDLRPNLLYMNDEHVRHLQQSFARRYDLAAIMRMLQMEILIDTDIVHPRVAWVQLAAARRAV